MSYFSIALYRLAQGAVPSLDVADLIQFGAIGIFLLSFMTSLVYPRSTVVALEKRVEILEGRLEAKYKKDTEQLIPVLVEATTQTARSTAAMEEFLRWQAIEQARRDGH